MEGFIAILIISCVIALYYYFTKGKPPGEEPPTDGEPPPEPKPDLEISSIAIGAKEVQLEQEKAIAYVTVVNRGGADGKWVIECRLRWPGYYYHMTQSVALKPGQSKQLTFSFAARNLGQHWFSVGTLAADQFIEMATSEYFEIVLPPPGWGGVIAGTVTDDISLAPVKGASIEVLGTGVITTSKSDGDFYCKNVYCDTPPVEGSSCSYIVRFSHPKYHAKEVSVVMPYAFVTLDVQLTALEPSPPPEINAAIGKMSFQVKVPIGGGRYRIEFFNTMQPGILDHMPKPRVINRGYSLLIVDRGDVKVKVTSPSGKVTFLKSPKDPNAKIALNKSWAISTNYISADEAGVYAFDVELWHRGELLVKKYFEFEHKL